MGWIEKYGTGIRRIRKIFQDYGAKEADFSVVAGCFAVIAYALGYKNNENVLEDVPVKDTVTVDERKIANLSKNKIIILEQIKNNNHITVEELSVIVGINLRNTKNNRVYIE